MRFGPLIKGMRRRRTRRPARRSTSGYSICAAAISDIESACSRENVTLVAGRGRLDGPERVIAADRRR